MKELGLSCSSCFKASARAATSIAGLSRKAPASCCASNKERTSCSSFVSPPQARRRKAWRFRGGCSSTACRMLSTCFHRSRSIVLPAGQFPIEPGLGRVPVPHHRDGRYLEHFGCLLYAESSKEAHLDDLRLARIEPRQRVHRLIERHQVRRLLAAHQGRLFQGNMLHAAPAFQVMAPRMFNQNAPHQLSRNREKMSAVLPLHAFVIHQAHVGLVDQGRGLEAMTGPLVFHIALCETMEFVIDDGREPIQRVSVSVTPSSEQPAHLSTRWGIRVIVLRLDWLPHSPPLRNLSPSTHPLQEKSSPHDSSDPPFAPI